MKETQKSAKSATAKASMVFTDEERAAMRELVQERIRARSGKADGESDVLAKIAEMPEPDRVMAERLHAIIKASAPTLYREPGTGCPRTPRTQRRLLLPSAHKFKSRYATFGFEVAANLDEGDMWPTSFDMKRLTADVEERISALVNKAVS